MTTDTVAGPVTDEADLDFVQQALDAAAWELAQDKEHELQILVDEAKSLDKLTKHYRTERMAKNRRSLVQQLDYVYQLRDAFYANLYDDIDVANTEAVQALRAGDAAKAHRAAQRRDKLHRLMGAVKAFFAKLWRKFAGTDIRPAGSMLHDRQFHKSQIKSVTPTPAAAVAPNPVA